MWSCRLVFGISLFLFVGTGFAQSEKKDDQDAADYLEAVQAFSDQPVESQIEGWNRFLKEHPNTSYQEEIKQNLLNLEDFLTNTDPKQMKEKRDTDRFIKASEFAKKLTLPDQILLWQQFIDENPNSLYLKEAKKKLQDLKSLNTPVTPPVKSSTSLNSKTNENQRVAPDLAYKDKQTAILFATFPGLIVPGMAHWYTKEYTMAGVLTGLRVGGLAVGIPAMIQKNRAPFIVGSLLVLFSYLADVVDAPYSVERYNADLEKQKGLTLLPSPPFEIALTYSF